MTTNEREGGNIYPARLGARGSNYDALWYEQKSEMKRKPRDSSYLVSVSLGIFKVSVPRNMERPSANHRALSFSQDHPHHVLFLFDGNQILGLVPVPICMIPYGAKATNSPLFISCSHLFGSDLRRTLMQDIPSLV